MVLSYILYTFALILIIYVIFRIVQKKNFKISEAIATLAIIVSILLALRNTPTPISPTPTSPEPIFTPSGPANWAVTFEYRLPVNNWSIGSHQYSLTAKCPSEDTTIVNNSFTVSNSYVSVPGDVYLRYAGLRKSKTYGAESVDGINPTQTTVGVVTWDQITEPEAKWRATNCSATVSWDGGTPQRLIPQTPFQH